MPVTMQWTNQRTIVAECGNVSPDNVLAALRTAGDEVVLEGTIRLRLTATADNGIVGQVESFQVAERRPQSQVLCVEMHGADEIRIYCALLDWPIGTKVTVTFELLDGPGGNVLLSTAANPTTHSSDPRASYHDDVDVTGLGLAVGSVVWIRVTATG